MSSKFDEFLVCGCNSTAIMASNFMRIHVANPRPLERFLRFIVLCFLRKKLIISHFARDALWLADQLGSEGRCKRGTGWCPGAKNVSNSLFSVILQDHDYVELYRYSIDSVTESMLYL